MIDGKQLLTANSNLSRRNALDSNLFVVGSIPTRPTIFKNLRGNLASPENEVVPLIAMCAMCEIENPKAGSIPRCHGVVEVQAGLETSQR